MQPRLMRYVISFATNSFSYFTKCSLLFSQSTVSCSAKYCFACLGKARLAVKLSKFPKVSATLACHKMKRIRTEITIFHMQLLSKPISRLNFLREIFFFRPKINLKNHREVSQNHLTCQEKQNTTSPVFKCNIQSSATHRLLPNVSQKPQDGSQVLMINFAILYKDSKFHNFSVKNSRLIKE